MFDWIRFLDSRGISYAESGPNVARGHVAIPCPFCGSADPSHHMAINVTKAGWRCYRNRRHAGRSPIRLVASLLGVSIEQAAAIVGGTKYVPSDILGRVNSALRPRAKDATKSLEIPPDFKLMRLIDGKALPSMRPYSTYLLNRGFEQEDIHTLGKRYGLRYATQGPFKGRIIFPVVFGGRLVSWTARTIQVGADLRYKALSDDPERSKPYPPAIGKLTDFLLWRDHLMRTDAATLVLVEGPFDALKVRVLGRDDGITATCFFTASPSANQVELLHEILPRFERRVLLLDKGTQATALRISGLLSSFSLELVELPPNIKDPGELKRRDFVNIFSLAS